MPDAQIIPFDGGASRAQRNDPSARSEPGTDPVDEPTPGDPVGPVDPVVTTDEGVTADADTQPGSAGGTVAVETASPLEADGAASSGVGQAAADGASAEGLNGADPTPPTSPASARTRRTVAGSGRGTASGAPRTVAGSGRGTASGARKPSAGQTPTRTDTPDQSDQPHPNGVEGPTEDVWDRRIAGTLAFLRRRLTGEYETDEFGFDPEFSMSVLAPALRPIYEKWFRVEISGLEHVSDTGGALIVANHSGTIPVDATMLQLGLLDHHPARRALRLLAADLVFQMPFVGELARKSGSTLACQPDAERLLSGGELVGVFPEGFKGVGKPFSERYKLQRFGRGGFVSAALATKAPIIPCAIVGAEEIYPKIGDAKIIARMFGLPYFPLTPTFPWLGPLGVVPLPSKWYIEFGEPIETSDLAAGAEDPMQVFNLTDQVRETIQQMLYRLLMKRRSVFG